MIEHTSYDFNKNYNLLIGIDQSLTHSGVVVFNRGELIFATGISTDTKDSSIEERIFYIRERVKEILIEYSPEYASIEGLAYGIASNNGRLLAGVFFSILTLLIEFNIPYKVVNPKTLKKTVTGIGSADKLLMRETIDEDILNKLSLLTKLKPTSKKFEDIVDAYWLCVNPIMDSI
jgi:Holliday junction resolvasome RuvABC endonuclease subunit